MRIKADWKGGMAFEATTDSGHTVLVDGPEKLGGKDSGPRPMELVLAAIAGCSGIDVVAILNKGGHEIKSLGIEVLGDRADAIPAVYEKIMIAFSIPGVDKKPAERAIKLSVEKYCSVIKMLDSVVEVGWKLQDEGGNG